MATGIKIGDKIVTINNKEEEALFRAFDKYVQGNKDLDEKIKEFVKVQMSDYGGSQTLLTVRRELGLVK